ncbi:uncharacterized protein LOC116603164 [Nematostella vectensis]|uniref:uncharacterized protein LOC116603164 n=1 Tax=Nematostella vectensis TaxID=45351 RepID=UPI002076E209|nr:uncharacterized protein LOC116603164 [Nematostella vectensis]
MKTLLSPAPRYNQRVKTHRTKSGRILCTGKGCLGCNPQLFGDKSVVDALGDVDSVVFDERKDLGVVRRRIRPETSPGCHGDSHKQSSGTNGQKTIKKLSNSQQDKTPSILVTKSAAKTGNGDKGTCKQRSEVEKRHEGGKNGKTNQQQNFNLLKVPKSTYYKKISHQHKRRQKESCCVQDSKEETRIQSSPDIRTIQQKHGAFYHTFPGVIANRGQLDLSDQAFAKTNFLEMLKKSETGIYDVRIMELDKSSKWVNRVLEQGAKVEDLLPRIPQVFRERSSGDGSEKQICDKNTQTATFSQMKTSVNFAETVLRNRFVMQGEEAVVIVEHEHGSSTAEHDTSLYRLGFAMEQVDGPRNFPKFSILEIAESLEEFVHMKVIKVIQRKERMWHILVKGRKVRDFLVRCGVVLGGRHFQLIELRKKATLRT